MATLVHQCPHIDCLTERMNFALKAFTTIPGERPKQIRNFVHASCSACGQPVAFEIADESGTGQMMPGIEQYPMSFEYLGWHVVRTWPEVPKPRIPDHVPAEVARAYLSAERSFLMKDMEETSAASYGRALDIGTKLFASDLAGVTLYNRIKRLAEQHRIAPDVARWADAIRVIRNDALHEIDRITRDELVAVRGFTETVLTYLFTLPGMLRERQALTKEKPKR